MELVIKRFNELSGKEVYEIGKIRQEVFIIEQKCIYLDLDEKDYNSLHIFYRTTEEIVGYCRVIPQGISYDKISIGRVLVNKKYRGKGIARKLLLETFKIIKERFEEAEIKIGAQNYLKEFYKSLGFSEISEVYDEDGIPHIDMYINLKNLAK